MPFFRLLLTAFAWGIFVPLLLTASALPAQVPIQNPPIKQGAGMLHVCPRCRRCFDHTQIACSADQTPLDSTRIFPYRIASRYRLTKLLGEGSMGLVFEVEDERLPRRLLLFRLERKGWPEKLEDTPSWALSSSDRGQDVDADRTYVPDGDETRLMDERPAAERERH